MMGGGSEPIFANLITGKVPRKELAFYLFREDNNLDSIYVYASWEIEVLLDTRRGYDLFHLSNTNTTSFKHHPRGHHHLRLLLIQIVILKLNL